MIPDFNSLEIRFMHAMRSRCTVECDGAGNATLILKAHFLTFARSKNTTDRVIDVGCAPDDDGRGNESPQPTRLRSREFLQPEVDFRSVIADRMLDNAVAWRSIHGAKGTIGAEILNCRDFGNISAIVPLQ